MGDELKLATRGKARVFGISLKDRAAILPAGFAGDGAYWIDQKTGTWITSTYYRSELPKWAQDFNNSKRVEKYLNLEWKDTNGEVLRTTKPSEGRAGGFYELVGSTPFANDYEFEFARELITYEKLGSGPATDLLIVSLSANDILGHQVGPDSPEMQAMALAMDRQLAGFFEFLGHQMGLANVWIALSADHGVAPLSAVAAGMHLPAARFLSDKMKGQVNSALSARFSHPGEYVKDIDYPLAWVNSEPFAAAKMKEEDAERAVGEALKQAGLRAYYTRSQLERGDVPNTEAGRKYCTATLRWADGMCWGSRSHIPSVSSAALIMRRPIPTILTFLWLSTAFLSRREPTGPTPNRWTWRRRWLRCLASMLHRMRSAGC